MSFPVCYPKPEYSGDNHPCNQKQVKREKPAPVPHSENALYVFETFRTNQFGCFTDETKAENRARLTRPNPYSTPRGKTGHCPSYWTELAGIKAPELPADWVDKTLSQPLPPEHPAHSHSWRWKRT